MQKGFVQDRDGRDIYLTAERWHHITSRHPELRGHRDDVLNAVRYGRRRQQPQDPQAYVYRWACNFLRPPFNGILVSVVFRFAEQADDGIIPNNFVVTAWGIMMRQ